MALHAFAKAAGVNQIEAALREHTGNATIQTKGIRALGSGVGWPRDVQVKSGYSWANTIEIALGAMSRHPDDAELQVVVLEAIEKCLNHLPSAQKVNAEGGTDMIKTAMAKHPGAARLQALGRKTLNHLSVNVSRLNTP